jgi:hypothetical protein
VGAVLLVNGKPAVRTRSPAPRSERVFAPPARSGGNGPTGTLPSQPTRPPPPARSPARFTVGSPGSPTQSTAAAMIITVLANLECC